MVQDDGTLNTPRLVFVSHCGQDTWVAKQIAREIERSGAKPFLDEAEIDAGADFPRYLAEAAADVPSTVPDTWRVGVRSRWEWGDVDNLALRLLRSRRRLDLASSVPGRGRALIEFLTHRPGRDRLEVFRMNDPLPFMVETMQRFGIRS